VVAAPAIKLTKTASAIDDNDPGTDRDTVLGPMFDVTDPMRAYPARGESMVQPRASVPLPTAHCPFPLDARASRLQAETRGVRRRPGGGSGGEMEAQEG